MVGNAGASSALVQRIQRFFFFFFSRRKEPAKKNIFCYSSENAWFSFSYFECSFTFLDFLPLGALLVLPSVFFSVYFFFFFFARPAKDKSRRKRNLWSDLLDVADRRDLNVSRCTDCKKGRITMVEENGVFCSFTARSMLKRERGASHDSLS